MYQTVEVKGSPEIRAQATAKVCINTNSLLLVVYVKHSITYLTFHLQINYVSSHTNTMYVTY